MRDKVLSRAAFKSGTAIHPTVLPEVRHLISEEGESVVVGADILAQGTVMRAGRVTNYQDIRVYLGPKVD